MRFNRLGQARIFGLLALLLGAKVGAQASPVGMWNTISDRDGKPTAVVEIREINGELSGVVRELLVAADPEDSVCGKCSGDRKGQRIVGMEIVRHMHADGDRSEEHTSELQS